MTARPARLTPKQERFVAEYLVDLNATQAAIRAGYSERTAASIGQENLGKPAIQEALAGGRARIASRLEVTQERVVKEYARLAFLDIRKAFDADGNLKAIHQLDDDTAAAIAGLEAEELFEGTGRDRFQVGNLRKIKLADKRGALDSLARHLGMFAAKDDDAATTATVQQVHIYIPDNGRGTGQVGG